MSQATCPAWVFNPSDCEPSTGSRRDIFAEAREKYTIPDLWRSFGFEGEPKASCRSPFREDRTPSFSIFDDGQAFTDHASGEGGDVIEFVRLALGGCDHKAVRDWFGERLGIDHYDFFAAPKPTKAPEPPKAIQWPSELLEGTAATWDAFAARRNLTSSGAWVLVKSGILRFAMIDGAKCFIVTDNERRAAEIRRIDGKPFGKSKAFPLPGVDKQWLPGANLLRGEPQDVAVMLVEGGTDLLTAVDLYVRYRKVHGGANNWQPVALLGGSCKKLAPECASLIRGRHVRIVPDADATGDTMRDHWTELFRNLECTVDTVTLPRGTDLTDHAAEIQPSQLFSK